MEQALIKNEASLNELKKQKVEMIKKFDEMIKNVADHEVQLVTDNNEVIRVINENLILVTSMKNTESAAFMDPGVVTSNLETINDIEQSITQSLSGVRTFRYYEYMKNTADVKSLCGEITAEQITVDLSGDGKIVLPEPTVRQPTARPLEELSSKENRAVLPRGYGMVARLLNPNTMPASKLNFTGKNITFLHMTTVVY